MRTIFSLFLTITEKLNNKLQHRVQRVRTGEETSMDIRTIRDDKEKYVFLNQATVLDVNSLRVSGLNQVAIS